MPCYVHVHVHMTLYGCVFRGRGEARGTFYKVQYAYAYACVV